MAVPDVTEPTAAPAPRWGIPDAVDRVGGGPVAAILLGSAILAAFGYTGDAAEQRRPADHHDRPVVPAAVARVRRRAGLGGGHEGQRPRARTSGPARGHRRPDRDRGRDGVPAAPRAAGVVPVAVAERHRQRRPGKPAQALADKADDGRRASSSWCSSWSSAPRSPRSCSSGARPAGLRALARTAWAVVISSVLRPHPLRGHPDAGACAFGVVLGPARRPYPTGSARRSSPTWPSMLSVLLLLPTDR